MRLSSILWPQPQTLEEYWSSDAGAEFLDKWFSIPKICQYFRTRSPVAMADNDGWHARDLIAPLFFNNNTDLHNLIRKRLILPYLTGSFHPSFIEEYAGGLMMALQKQDGGVRSILCGEIWRRCFASLAVNATPVRNEAAKLFTSILLMITLFKQQVFEMVPRIARRSSRFSMITLIHRILMIPNDDRDHQD